MKKRHAIAASLCLILVFPFASSCDFLLGLRPMHLYDQALDAFHSAMEQSVGIKPYSAAATDSSKTYAGEAYSGDVMEGTATFSGTHSYDYSYTSTGDYTSTTVRRNEYDGLSVSFDRFQRFDYNLSILSGELTMDGAMVRTTNSNTYTGYSNTTESGSFTVKGSIEIQGVSEGEEVKDRISIDVTRSLTGGTWFYNGTLSNMNETWDIYME